MALVGSRKGSPPLPTPSFPESAFLVTGFERDPPGSTERFTRWANGLSREQLFTQVDALAELCTPSYTRHAQAYTTHGPTLAAPTWFCARGLVEAVGGFAEAEPIGFPEDLHFFYRLLRLPGARLLRLDDVLLTYRHHGACASLAVKEATLLAHRNAALAADVLPGWQKSGFSIWNAGKAGKAFFGALPDTLKVNASQNLEGSKRPFFAGLRQSLHRRGREKAGAGARGAVRRGAASGDGAGADRELGGGDAAGRHLRQVGHDGRGLGVLLGPTGLGGRTRFLPSQRVID